MTTPLTQEEFDHMIYRAQRPEELFAPWVARDDRAKLLREVMRLRPELAYGRKLDV